MKLTWRHVLAAMIAFAGGCASPPGGANTGREAGRSPAAHRYEESNAAALAFIAPATQDEPPVMLARDVREPSAFMGFEEQITIFSYINTWDHQSTLCGDRQDQYQRDAVSTRVSVTTK